MLVAGLAANVALAAGPGAAQSEQGINLRAFRFYRAENRQTLVTAFVEVPYALLERTGPGPAAELKYGVIVTVTDLAGGTLYEASWPGGGRADLATAGARKLEILDVAVPAGRYRIAVTVTDSVSGRQYSGGTEVEGWAEPPGASDLMLSPAMRLASGDDTVPRAGELRRGNTMVTPATDLRLTPLRPKAFYLLEVYGAGSDSGTMQVRVVDSTGRALVSTRPAPVVLAQGGSVLKGQLDLSGLPAGRYSLTVVTDLQGRKEERSDGFVMADFQEAMQREGAQQAAWRESDEGYFAAMGQEELEAAVGPLVYLAGSDSLAPWKSGLSLAAKQRFLTRFWEGRDPSLGTPRNEARETFYKLIGEANRRFAERGRGAGAGWRTDRGRIFVKYGGPSEMLDRPVASGRAPPYQVWRYLGRKDVYYIFVDRTGLGGYRLIASNDLRETSIPGFREILGGEALQDISRWLGVDLFQPDQGGSRQ
jgi:GWxTD domain-containing protein